MASQFEASCQQIMTVAEMADRKAWLKVRASGIGGSDAASILGMNPWKSAYELWLEKTGQKQPEDVSDKEAVYWGTAFEAIVAREFTNRTGKKVRRQGMVQSRQHGCLLANIDRLVIGEPAGLECKTASAYKEKEWEGDKVPDAYYVQCQHYMLVTGLPRWYIAALIGGNHYVWKCIERDENDIAALLKAEENFWQHVKKGTPPAIDGSESCARALAERFQGGHAEVLPLPLGGVDLATRLRALKCMKKDLDEQITEAENRLKEFLGDYETAVFGTEHQGGKVTWRRQAGRTTIDTKRLQKERPDVYAAYSKQGKATRVFRVTFTGDEEN